MFCQVKICTVMTKSDRAFTVLWIRVGRVRIQQFWSMRIRIKFRIRIQRFDEQKILQLKKGWFVSSKLAIYSIYPRPPWRTSKLQEKSSVLKRGYPAFQNMKFFPFSIFMAHFALLDPEPDPADQTNVDPFHITELFCSQTRFWLVIRPISKKLRYLKNMLPVYL